MVIVIDWTQLARDVGSLHDGGEAGGTAYATAALDRILGEDNIASAVELIVSGGRGGELAMNVLRHIHSERAARLAYAIYRTSSGDRANSAAWLIKHLAHPCALPWIGELLRDPNVAVWGVGVIDQLVCGGYVDPAEVEHLLVEAEHHSIENVRDNAAFIRQLLRRRAGEPSEGTAS